MGLKDENDILRRQNHALKEASTAAAYNLHMVKKRLRDKSPDLERLESFVDASIAWFDRVGGMNPMPSSVYQMLLDCESALTKIQDVRAIDDTSPAPYDVIFGIDNAELLARLAKVVRPKPKGAL